MKQIKIIIEASKDSFGAYAESDKYPVTGIGETVQEAKKSVLESIEINKELGNIPNETFNVVFKYDTQSILSYYKGILSNSGFEKITGINQKQIQHYSTGLKKPRPAQIKKIKSALQQLGAELMAVEL
jgi:hypothetical protein